MSPPPRIIRGDFTAYIAAVKQGLIAPSGKPPAGWYRWERIK